LGSTQKRPFAERVCVIETVPIGGANAEIAVSLRFNDAQIVPRPEVAVMPAMQLRIASAPPLPTRVSPKLPAFSSWS